ncbi:MAG: alpha/beta fold hydrolase [Gammaproteobacteria bacterium]|nr:alpha/beta fold hydrolase [Gammaproteobacteria bacterium]
MTIVLTLVFLLLAGYGLLSLFIRRGYRAPRIVESGTPADFGLPFHEESIPTANGRRLFAWYIPPPGESRPAPAVVVMHGWGSNAELMLPFAGLLHRSGYATLLVDARNHGRSDGDAFSSMPRFAEDLEHGFDWLTGVPEVDSGRIALLGHSVGAAAVLLVASRRPQVAAVVSIAAFAHPEELMRRQMRFHRIPRPIAWLVLRYVERTIGARYEAIAPINTIGHIRCPVLLAHGAADRSVPVQDATAIYGARAHAGVELMLVPEADHDSVDRIEGHGDEIADFLQRSFRDAGRKG